MSDWKSVIEAHERLTETSAKYEHALSHLIQRENIGAFQALRIMSEEVQRAHGAVMAALASIPMTQNECASGQVVSSSDPVAR
jgi:hypothetical protein